MAAGLARLLGYRRRWGVVRSTAWKSLGSLTDITFGTVRLGATFEKIDWELPFTEAATNTVARVYVQARENGQQPTEFTVRDGIVQRIGAGEQSQFGTQSAAYGIVPLVTAGTTYEVLAWVQDANGLWVRVYLGTVTTRAEDIADAATLTPTRYVGTGGDDLAAGTSLGAKWATTEKALTSMPGAGVAIFGPGFYGPGQVNRTSSGTFRAEYPAVDDNLTLINQGLWSVIEPITVTAPTGTTAHTPGNADYSIGSSNPYTVAPWVAVTLQGTGQTTTGGTFAAPTTPAWYGGDGVTPDGTIWKLTGVPAIDAQALAQVGYSAHRADNPGKIGHTRPDTAVCATAGGWAEILFTNQWYNDSGCILIGTDLYVVLPSHARRADGTLSRNPNDYWMFAGGDDIGLKINADSIRYSGFAIWGHQHGFQSDNPRAFAVVDHCYIGMNGSGVRHGQGSVSTNGLQSFTGYANNAVVQYCYFEESNFWRPNADGIPWWMCKSVPVLQNGLTYNAASGYTGAVSRWTQMENTAVSARGGGVRTVMRHNTVDGYFNGWTPTGFSTSEGRYSGYAAECYGNTFKHLIDDTWECDQQAVNVAMWRNIVEQALVGISLGPCDFGPIYVWENALYLGRAGIAKRATDADNSTGLSCALGKHSGGSAPRATAFLSNITLVGDEVGVWGPGELASPTGSNEEGLDIRNCIYAVTGRLVDCSTTQVGWYTESSNVMASNNLAGGLSYGFRWNGVAYLNDLAAYLAASGQGGATGHKINGSYVDTSDPTVIWGHLRDPLNAAARDMRLKDASYALFVGEQIAGFTRNVSGRNVRMGYEP